MKWGFDTKGMDKGARPTDDFYSYANGGWIKKSVIPKAEARWGSFNILRVKTEKQLRTILNDIVKKKNLKTGTVEQQVRDVHKAALDMKTRDKRGHSPIEPYLAKVRSIKTKKDLIAVLGYLEREKFGVLWSIGVEQDAQASDRYALDIHQAQLGMPDRDYYLVDSPEFLRVRTEYKTYMRTLLTLCGVPRLEVDSKVVQIMKFETALARIHMSKVDERNVDKVYNRYTSAMLKKLFAPLGWEQFITQAKIPKTSYAIVGTPDYVRNACKMIDSVAVDEWRTFLEWEVIRSGASYLSMPFVRATFEFYGTVLSGQKKMREPWRRALGITNAVLGFGLGRMYVDKYFGAVARKKMHTLVDDLFSAYETRMRAITWMSPKTKKMAIVKLRAISRKIGAPKKWQSYKELVVLPDDHFGNMMRAAAFARRRQFRRLKKKVNRGEWLMSPQTVNAYCNFTMNEIVFPAAILQHPFFDATASDDAVNYGAIGSVIGHELTHAFDDQGCKFDKKGNMHNWWTKADKKNFEKRAQVLVKQYNAFKVADGVTVNGELTLGENIADLGGLVIAYDAYQTHLKKVGRKNIDGYTPEQRFFLGFAQQERELVRPELQKTMALNDPHSPAPTRINGPLAHFQPFYDAFDVAKKNALYREPSARAQIW